MELHRDNPDGFAVLLSYIYEPERSVIVTTLRPFMDLQLCSSFLCFRRYDPNAPTATTGTARLPNKYLLELLRKQLISYAVGEWDIQQAEINVIKQTILSVTTVDGEGVHRGQLLSTRIAEPVSVIIFARELGRTKILPAAFYRLLQISFKADWSLCDIRGDDDDGDDGYAHTRSRDGAFWKRTTSRCTCMRSTRPRSARRHSASSCRTTASLISTTSPTKGGRRIRSGRATSSSRR